jgi:hypothetical protein
MGRLGLRGVLVAAAVFAAVSARPYAGSWNSGGWNDGSRLAAVESLVDHHTFAIDDSIYINPSRAARSPYGPDNTLAARDGTLDKLLIDGRYYSDKSPVPALPMAAVYQLWRWAGGPPAADRPDRFALLLTWVFASIPYVLAAWALGRTIRTIGVPEPWDTVLVGGFAFATLAAPYAENVNNHILLLAVAAGVCDAVVRRSRLTAGRAAWLGLLAGFGYSIDLGAGPPLAVAVFGFVLWQARGPARWPAALPLLAFVGAALPFVAGHHAITYAIAGAIGPANANPAYLQWPGSPFNSTNTTGGWAHASVCSFLLYCVDLLFGKKGFLLYSPMLLLVLVALPHALRRPGRDRQAVLALGAWATATWLLYAATSRNLSGACLSVRWFVPLLAPGILAIGILIRDLPASRRDLGVLIAGGLVLNVELVVRGPFYIWLPKLLWPVVGLTLTSWLVLAARRVPRTAWPTPRNVGRRMSVSRPPVSPTNASTRQTD